MSQPRLPVEEILDELKQLLSECHEIVLEAPPGAGKTTLIPLALRHEPWLSGKKILMLEPRRIATKSAAFRMSSLIGEPVGQTVGYRMRLDTRISRNTIIEVITEGILTRMLQQDPSLEDVGLVIFDEFHERNLDSDLALALCLNGRALFRHEVPGNNNNQTTNKLLPLKILVMSATLDSDAIAKLLGDAPVIKSEGRVYPVDVIYGRASQPKENIVDRMVVTIKQALAENPNSSLLAFLPGQGEIRRTTEHLSSWLLEKKIKDIHLRPLFGNLSIEDQQQAIAPLSGNESNDRKLVLATNIAETSLTIEGVDVVVDSGLAREPQFDSTTGMTRLQTVRISRTSSVQRKGRAGRLRAGKCYRLWSAQQQQQLAPFALAEILNADLAPLVLQLLQWGVADPTQLSWLDPPPKGTWQQALMLLESLGAIEKKASATTLSAHGQDMVSLPVHPRLAHLLLCGKQAGYRKAATLLASLLSDRNPFSRDNPDISLALDILMGDSNCPPQHLGWLRRSRKLANQFDEQLNRLNTDNNKLTYLFNSDQLTGYLLSRAYPDRIARRRHSGAYQLANGRSANLIGQHHLAKSRWLCVAEVSGIAGAKGDSIRSAAPLDEGLFSNALSDLIRLKNVAEWDLRTNRFVAEEQQKIGALILHRKTLNTVPADAKTAVLIQTIRKQGLNLLPWTSELHQWCARVSLLRSIEKNQSWPDLSQNSLLDTMEDWLAPYLGSVNLLQDFKKLNLKDILETLLPREKRQRLNLLAPPRLKVASGSSIAIDYTETPPVLAVKLQEMFGCKQSPTLVEGKVPLVVHLLSPAGRPLQITQDLAGFWKSSYHQVKKEMKGRYPKHPWPDDPLAAVATRKTKSRAKNDASRK